MPEVWETPRPLHKHPDYIQIPPTPTWHGWDSNPSVSLHLTSPTRFPQLARPPQKTLVENHWLCDKGLMNGDFTTGPPILPAMITEIRICGVINWTCRHCGWVNHERVNWRTQTFKCSNHDCNRMMLPVQHDVLRGHLWPWARHRSAASS